MSFNSDSTSYMMTLSVNASRCSERSLSTRMASSSVRAITWLSSPGVAAQLLRLRAGQSDATALQQLLSAALRLMHPAAQAAGYPQPKRTPRSVPPAPTPRTWGIPLRTRRPPRANLLRRATTALPHLGQTYPKLLVSSIKSTSLSLFQVIWSQYTPSCRIFPVPVFFWA